MELSSEFEVALPIAEAWNVLTDVERIAPCMPGAELKEVDGDAYKGVVKVKVGPITAQYQGTARFVERDDTSHKAVLRAEGRETRGQGNASATITAQLASSGNITKVALTTDLHITGKVAQFGRGVLADVSNKLVGQFVENLESTVLAAGSPPARGPETRTTSGGDGAEADTSAAGSSVIGSSVAHGSSRHGSDGTIPHETEPVDLLRVAGVPLARRVAPVGAVVLGVVVLLALIRRMLKN